MPIFVKVRVEPKALSLDQPWEIWEKEAGAAEGAVEAGKFVAAHRVAGQRRVIGVDDVDSPNELAGLPTAHHPEFGEILAVREYKDVASDTRRRWQ